MNSGSLKWCALPAIAIIFLSLVPQVHLWLARGSQWNGAYASVDGDEFLYSAYLNALIDGRPRRNDPFSGRDDNPSAPLPESTFSIQLIPPFVIASLARACGASASTAFIVLIGVAGLLASVTVFWLLLSLTVNNRLSAVGTVFVLCLGTLAAGQGLFGLLLNADVSTVGLAFLRRYQPAASFSIFFAFCTLVWRALVSDRKRSARLYSALAGFSICLLIFSYLYLWTAGAAWLTCISLLWCYFRPQDWRRTLEVVVIVTCVALCAVAPYIYLLLHRASNLDQTQTLTSTHRPDVFRIPEIIGVLILLLIVAGIRSKKIEAQNPTIIFAASLALLPVVIFNQQLLTGESMQPFHFEHFIANYAVLVSLVIAVAVLWISVSSRILLWAAALSLLWGAIEVDLPARSRLGTDIVNDQMVPLLLRLKTLTVQDGTLSGLRSEGKTQTFVFSPQIEVLRFLPTWTAQGVMIGLGGLDFGSASSNEQKVYSYLYYCGVDKTHLVELLKDRTNDPFMNYYTRSAMFGHERALANLSFYASPISDAEIEGQVRSYETYVARFSREEALKHPITYVAVLPEGEFDFSRIDLWYERDAGERVGPYDLYRLKLRVN
jgi:hypothetical protein